MYNSTYQGKYNRKYTFGKNRSNVSVGCYSQPCGIEKSFYQACTYANPKTNKYTLREWKVIPGPKLNGGTDRQLTKAQMIQFMNEKAPHEYKKYSTYDINIIGAPNLADIMLSQSDILDYKGDCMEGMYSSWSNFSK